MAAFKTTSNERRKTARQFARVEARNERTAQRRSLRLSPWSLKHGHGDLRSLGITAAKNAGLLRAAFTALNPVWAGAHDLEFEFEFEVEVEVKKI